MEMFAGAMDFFSPYFLPIALFFVSLYFLYLASWAKSSPHNSCPLPQGKTGWPILGESLDFLAAGREGCPERFVSDRASHYSLDVFRTSLLRENVAVFCGAPGNKFLFSADNKYVKMWWPKSVSKVLYFLETGEDTRQVTKKVRSYLPDFLKPEPLKRFIPIMDSTAKDHLARNWSPNGQVSVFPSAKDYTFDLASQIFMNIKDAHDIEKLYTPFAYITPGLLSMPINIPGTPFNKAVEGGKKIREQLINVIRKRKEEIKKGEDGNTMDLLTRLLKESEENEMEISNTIIGLLFASHHTTSTAITFVVNYLAEFPHIYDQVSKEQMEIAKSKHKGEMLTWEDIQKMKYSWNVACESMRLSPPGLGAFREAVTDFTYAGYTIPKGWKAFWTVYSTHKNPKYFPDPEKFDPTRFEGSGPAPFTFIPFGGGPGLCPGKEFARLQILAFIHNLVTMFSFEKVDPNEKISYNPSPVLTNGLLLRLTPR